MKFSNFFKTPLKHIYKENQLYNRYITYIKNFNFKRVLNNTLLFKFVLFFDASLTGDMLSNLNSYIGPCNFKTKVYLPN